MRVYIQVVVIALIPREWPIRYDTGGPVPAFADRDDDAAVRPRPHGWGGRAEMRGRKVLSPLVLLLLFETLENLEGFRGRLSEGITFSTFFSSPVYPQKRYTP